MPRLTARATDAAKAPIPQLAVLVDRPPSGPEWVHEIKYDGYRTLTVIRDGSVRFLTRSGLDWTDRYGDLASIAKKLRLKSAVFDGEVAALDEQGRSDFGRLQEALKLGKPTDLVYYVFDCLEIDGRDLRDKPLTERKRELAKVLGKAKGSAWIYSEDFDSASLLRDACDAGLEGVVSKMKTAAYFEGRSDVWQKSKCGNEQEFVIVGYTSPRGGRERFGALLLAVREGRNYRYVGKVGTGFSSKTLGDLHRKFGSCRMDRSPLTASVPEERRVTWLKPVLVAQIRFAGWTPDGHIRHAVYLGLREDKPASEVQREAPKTRGRNTSRSKVVKNDGRATSKPRVSHPDRKVFPGVTKNELALYYGRVGNRMISLVGDRPLSLLRCPAGVKGECFFQKHLDGESMIVAREPEDFLRFVQMGAIEIHSANVHLQSATNPDMVVFDLDPGPGVSWSQVIEGAYALKETLDHIGLRSFVKLSGGKGVHIHVSISPKYTYREIRAFAKAVVEDLAIREPRLYLIKMTKSERKGRIFLDYFRNNEGATAVAPYSVRARGRGTIALPISWSNLKADLQPDSVLLEDFVKLPPDPWRGFRSAQTIALLESKDRNR